MRLIIVLLAFITMATYAAEPIKKVSHHKKRIEKERRIYAECTAKYPGQLILVEEI